MTRDTHATGSPRQAARRKARPDLGRPSLFADFDQDAVEDIDPQRIRLLSTLESQRGGRGRPRSRRRPTGRGHPWLTRSLIALMGLGMLVMLASFIQLLRRPPPEITPTVSAPANSVTSLKPPALAAALDSPDPIAQAAEIIEFDPPAAAPMQPPAEALKLAGLATPEAPAAPAVSNQAATAPEQATRTARPPKAPPQREGTRREVSASADDVALVEAMLAHAGPRKAAASPTEAFKQCGTGSAPETAVCRARVCVQHPGLPACHAP